MSFKELQGIDAFSGCNAPCPARTKIKRVDIILGTGCHSKLCRELTHFQGVLQCTPSFKEQNRKGAGPPFAFGFLWKSICKACRFVGREGKPPQNPRWNRSIQHLFQPCGNKPVEQSLGSLGEIGGPAQSVHFQNIGDHNSATKLFASLHLFQAWEIRLFVQLASRSQESIYMQIMYPNLGAI